MAALAACTLKPQPMVVPGGNAEQGKKLLAQYQCGSCHQIPGVAPSFGHAGPPLDAFGLRSYIAGQFPNYPDPLIAWIRDAPAMKPGTLMPNMGVPAGDARHMAAYLYSLQ